MYVIDREINPGEFIGSIAAEDINDVLLKEIGYNFTKYTNEPYEVDLYFTFKLLDNNVLVINHCYLRNANDQWVDVLEQIAFISNLIHSVEQSIMFNEIVRIYNLQFLPKED